jgi:predicted enzyme related to lactoylglutathione lyase
VTDFERAVNFYGSILKIDSQVFDYSHEKMACFPNSEGAISCAPGFNPGRDGTLVSFNAEKDLEGAINRVTENEGPLFAQNKD